MTDTTLTQPLRFIKVTKEDVFTSGYLIADQEGRAQLHTLRTSRAFAWRAMVAGKITRKRREELKRMGFRSVKVHLESFNVFQQRGERYE